MKNDDIKRLKACKRLLMIAMAGSIGISAYGCNKKNYESSVTVDSYAEEQVVNTNENYDEGSLISTEEISEPIDVKVYKDNTYGYASKKTVLMEEMINTSNVIKKIDKFQKIFLIEKSNGWTKIKYGKNVGYIESNKVSKIGKTFIDVDISKQQLKYYSKGKTIFKSDVVTGLKDSRDTVLGCYKIYSKQQNTYLVGPGYRSHVDYWMPFYKGYGMHDADWRGSFGDEIYKTDGSHGCVNMPDSTAKKVYEKSKVGTKVLIHK